jgi:hypothetical protein
VRHHRNPLSLKRSGFFLARQFQHLT